jgi:hypothetical protein
MVAWPESPLASTLFSSVPNIRRSRADGAAPYRDELSRKPMTSRAQRSGSSS